MGKELGNQCSMSGGVRPEPEKAAARLFARSDRVELIYQQMHKHKWGAWSCFIMNSLMSHTRWKWVFYCRGYTDSTHHLAHLSLFLSWSCFFLSLTPPPCVPILLLLVLFVSSHLILRSLSFIFSHFWLVVISYEQICYLKFRNQEILFHGSVPAFSRVAQYCVVSINGQMSNYDYRFYLTFYSLCD